MHVKKSIFQLSKYFMLSAGLWKLPITSKRNIQRGYIIYSKLIQGIYFIFSMSVLIEAILIVTGVNKTDKIFNSISVALIMNDMNIKMMLYLIYRLPEMFTGLLQEEQLLIITSDKEILDVYLSQCNFFMGTSIVQLLSTIVPTFFYIFLNMVQFSLSDKAFMYEMWIPFHISWKCIATFKVFICLYGFVINSALHIGLQSLIIYVTSHLRILQIRLGNIFKKDNSSMELILNLRMLIQEHQYLIKFVENLNKSVNTIIFLDFVIDSINLAAAMVQLVTARTIDEALFSMVYFILLLCQLFILAWSANEIIIQSFNISNAIYENNWMDQSEPIKKTLLIMLMRAQKPLCLKIGPFRPMNMEAGLMTLKGSYTYAGVMQQTL